jgi:hypothetical protein
MAIKKSAASTEDTTEIIAVSKGIIDCYILGTTPIILNRMPEKAWRELLAPKGRKTAADKAGSMKHDPMEEFRNSPYRMPFDNDPTLIAQVGSAFKKALANAALDMPGAKKAQIGRLTYVPAELVPIYGIPQVLCSIVRSADMNKTPDVRTRVIVPKWAVKLSIEYVTPLLREKPVIQLLAAAGIYSGVGDWRPEKGAGSYGQFKLVSADDDEFNHIVKVGGRKAQIAAMKKPEAYNDETRELLDWFGPEMQRRGFKIAA